MGIRKTDRDIEREDIALEVTRQLHAAGLHGVSVVGGGRKGPYTLIVERLSRKRLGKVIGAITQVWGK